VLTRKLASCFTKFNLIFIFPQWEYRPSYPSGFFGLLNLFALIPIPNILPLAEEEDRLRALERYRLLDARREAILDDVVAATARLFHVSNAMLSIVEGTEVLIKAPYKLPIEIERVPRQFSLCSATVQQDDTAVFEDLNKGGAPGIDLTMILQLGLHFYAGHNLRTPDGHNIGTLCLLDGPPRHFALAERHLLGQLAGLVMHLLELRRTLGPHSGLTAMLWGAIYRSMSEQLASLNTLAERATSGSGTYHLTTAMAQQASTIVTSLDQFVAATLRRA
jgi:hypothetical protein